MKSAVKAVGAVMAIMLFSRLLSLVSNMAYITYFGINLETDIYSYAIQLPNIFFNSLGTAIVTVVIPVFAGLIGTDERERAFRFAGNITGVSLAFTAVLSIAGVILTPFILLLTRFRTEGYGFALTALRIMFPIMIFHALSYIFQGILQSLGKYGMPAFVSVPSSLVVIFYVIAFGNRFGVMGLVIATFIGLALQALILIPPLLKSGCSLLPSFNYRDEDVRRALKLVPPILIGTSAYQLNMLFNATLSANFKDTVALISTVQNLVLYAILAFVYSITAVMFPRLTMLAARGDMEGYRNSIQKVLRWVIYLLVPATAGFFAVRYPLVDLLYGWGKVTGDNVTLASNILALYALGITGIGVKEVLDRAFYSIKDTVRPALNGVIVMAVNIVFSLILISFMGVLGIPLAFSISALTGGFVIVLMIRKRVGEFGGRNLLLSGFKVAAASAIMLMTVIPLVRFATGFAPGHALVDKALRLFIPTAAGAFLYLVLTCIMRVNETKQILERLQDGLKFRKEGN